MKYLLTIILCGLLSSLIHAQDMPPTRIPTPTAAGICRYGDVPVSYYTGTANICIPIYSTTQRGVRLDVQLNYDSSGHLVNSLPGNVGHGWTLQAGGAITRVMKVNYDEYGGNINPRLSNNNYFNPATRNTIANLDRYLEEPNTSYADILQYSSFDMSPDVFIFNFMGKHGRFFYDITSEEWKVMCDENLRVELNVHDPQNFIPPFINEFPGNQQAQPNTIRGFAIYDQQGIKYVFGGESRDDTEAIEYSTNMAACSSSNDSVPWNAMSWYLKRIEDRLGNTLYEFSYQRGYFIAQIAYGFDATYARLANGHRGWLNHKCEEVSSCENDKFPYCATLNSPVYLSQIRTLDNKCIDFTNSPREQEMYPSLRDYLNRHNGRFMLAFPQHEHCGQHPFHYLQNTNDDRFSQYIFPADSLDFYPLRATCHLYLDEITVKNDHGSIVDKFRLSYKANPRMFLRSITNRVHISDNWQYKFKYNHEDELPADYASTAFDHWGYYNARENVPNEYDGSVNDSSMVFDLVNYRLSDLNPGGLDSIEFEPGGRGNAPRRIMDFQEARPGELYVPSNEEVDNAIANIKRSPDSTACLYGLLTEISYPTGGKTVLQYEPNRCRIVIGEDRSSIYVLGNDMLAGGARISSISNYSSPDDTNPQERKTYIYNEPGTSHSSGELYALPRYEWSFNFRNGTSNGNPNAYYCRKSSSSVIPLSNSFGPHLGYSYVKEVSADGTSKVHQYTNFTDAKDSVPLNVILGWSSNEVSFIPLISMDSRGYMFGALKKTDHYDSQSHLVRRTTYKYREDADRVYVPAHRFEVVEGSFSGHLCSINTFYTGRCYYPRYDLASSTDNVWTSMNDGSSAWISETTDFYKEDYKIKANADSVEIRLETGQKTEHAGKYAEARYQYQLSDTSFTNHFFLPILAETKRIDGTETQRTETVYARNDSTGQVMPTKQLQSVYGKTPVTLCEYRKYTSSGLPAEYLNEQGQRVLLFWKNELSVAQVVNPQGIVSANGNAQNSTDVVSSNLNNSVFGSLPVDVTSCVYDAFGRITSLTTANQQTLHYQYDLYGRLSKVTDNNGRVLSKFRYGFATGGYREPNIPDNPLPDEL